MKVVHVITGLHVGGAESMLLKLLSAMDASRFRSEVVSLLAGGENRARIEDLGIRCHDLGLKAGQLSPGSILGLRRLARELTPDLVQGWMYHGNLAATVLGKFAPERPPVFWNIRHSLDDFPHEKVSTRMVIRLGAVFSGSARRIIFNSGVSQEQHALLGFRRDKGLMLPNGFDLERFRPSPDSRAGLRGELGLPADAVLVGMAARRHPVKGHEMFLEAAARVAVGSDKVHYLMVGRGVTPDDPVLGSLAGDSGLAGRVHLLGPRRDMPSFLAGLDLLCVPSHGEGFSNVLGEAMACGVPCVATDVGESREIIGDTGLVVKPGDPGLLAEALGEMLMRIEAGVRQPDERCRDRIRSNYSLARIVRQYEELYQSA